jgi:hypothetical protein
MRSPTPSFTHTCMPPPYPRHVKKTKKRQIKKISGAAMLKLVHERYGGRNGQLEQSALIKDMATAVAHNR